MVDDWWLTLKPITSLCNTVIQTSLKITEKSIEVRWSLWIISYWSVTSTLKLLTSTPNLLTVHVSECSIHTCSWCHSCHYLLDKRLIKQSSIKGRAAWNPTLNHQQEFYQQIQRRTSTDSEFKNDCLVCTKCIGHQRNCRCCCVFQ